MAGRTSIRYLTSEGCACFEIIVAVRQAKECDGWTNKHRVSNK